MMWCPFMSVLIAWHSKASQPSCFFPGLPLNRFIVCVYASLVSYGLMVFVDLVKKNLDFEEKSVFFSILLNKHLCVTVRECSEHPLFSGL